MKKLILKTTILAFILAFTSPLAVNAANLKIDKDEMKVGEPVEVTVTTDKPVELMQFDLSFDKTKYEFVNATSELDSTGYNVIKNKDVVRVSAFDLNGDKTDTIKLNFKAIATGESVPFTVGGVVELGEDGEDFGSNITVKVTKIGESDNGGDDWGLTPPDDNYYISEDGTVITKLPQTGAKRALGNFSKLGALSHVIPYALSDSEDSITKQDVESEFATMTDNTIKDILRTGDTIEIDGIEHNLVLYGDVNKDGKVTTSDALAIYKGRDKDGTITLDNVQKEAADVQNDGEVNKEDAFAVQEFILQSRKTQTGTIINRNPVKTIEDADIEISANDDVNVKKYNYSKVEVATITAKNGAKLTQELLKDTKLVGAPDGAETNNVLTIDISEDGTVATIYVYTTISGNYMVRPVISGSDVENGSIRKNTITIKSEANNAVTSIKILDGDENITNSNIVLGPSQSKKPTIEFYHTDYDMNGNPVGEPRKVNVNANKAFMGIVPDGCLEAESTLLRNNNDEPIKYDANKKPLSGAAEGTFVDSIFVKSEELIEDTQATITIEVNNSEYGMKNYQKVIKVDIKQSERKTGIQLDGKTNPATQELTLYTADPSKPNVRVEDNGMIYTIIPITLGDGTKLKSDQVSTSRLDDVMGKINVFENASKVPLYIDVKGYAGNVTDGYIPTVTGDDPITAIGIALDNSEDDYLEAIKQGITIKYDIVKGNKVAHEGTINVNVSVEDGTATTMELFDEEDTAIEEPQEIDSLELNNVDSDSLTGQDVQTDKEGKTGNEVDEKDNEIDVKDDDKKGKEPEEDLNSEKDKPVEPDKVVQNKNDITKTDEETGKSLETTN